MLEYLKVLKLNRVFFLLQNQRMIQESVQAQAEHVLLSRARSLGAPAASPAININVSHYNRSDIRQLPELTQLLPIQQLQQQQQQQQPQLASSPPLTPQQQQPQQTPQHRRLERASSEPAPATPATPPNASRYKTELCRPYEEAGACKYGDKCQFAHGMRELRNLQRHPKYKTELCRTFHSVGFCPYGPRCHFVHNADEVRANNQCPPTPPSTKASSPSTPTGSSPLSRSPAASVSSFLGMSPSASPSQTPPPSPPEEGRLPVFNRLMSIRDMA